VAVLRTGVISSATPAQTLYTAIAADLAANPNWSRPASNPTITTAVDAYGTATGVAEVWKNTVGSASWFLVLYYDTASPTQFYVTLAEAYDGSDGGGVPGAKRFRRIPGGGTVAGTIDTTAVTPATNDLVSNADVSLGSTSPNFVHTNLNTPTTAFSYLYKVGNKALTIGINASGTNRWVHVGAFESLVTGPSDPMPIAMFTHGINNIVNMSGTVTSTAHGDGVVCRNPGLGVTAEAGAFFAKLEPLHASQALSTGAFAVNPSSQGYNVAVPRYYTKPLMSQAVIHQSRQAGTLAGQMWRGYYPDLFAAVVGAATEPTGGGVDSVVIDGVTYYWLGMGCPGTSAAGITVNQSNLVAVRAD
jgi:hypothetical protein